MQMRRVLPKRTVFQYMQILLRTFNFFSKPGCAFLPNNYKVKLENALTLTVKLENANIAKKGHMF